MALEITAALLRKAKDGSNLNVHMALNRNSVLIYAVAWMNLECMSSSRTHTKRKAAGREIPSMEKSRMKR